MASPLHVATLVLLLLALAQARKVRDSHRTVSGTVFCDRCLETRLTRNSIVFSDARLVVRCGEFDTVVSTNGTGQFTVEIPAKLHTGSCSVELLSKPPELCNTSDVLVKEERKAVVDLMYVPNKPYLLCEKHQGLTLGPPDPPQPSSVKQLNSYHLGPPDPPRPTNVGTKSYRLVPPNPPQPRVHN